MTPILPAERYYAESVKYGGEVILLIPLHSGEWVVMRGDRKPLGKLPPSTPLAELASTPPLPVTRFAPSRMREIIGPVDPNLPLIDLEDI